MILIEKHAQEIFWLNRRIEFLTKLNELLDIDETAEVAESYARQFAKVENPKDLIERLKEIYGREIK